jgi:acyltransferase
MTPTNSPHGDASTSGDDGGARRRSAAIDLVRVVGVIAIVAGHVWGLRIVHDALFSWHVPLFFFLTGFLWRNERTLKDEMSRRTQTLAKPYLFWFAILYVGFVGLQLGSGMGEIQQWLYPFYGGAAASLPFTTFWFVSVLFTAAILWRSLDRAPGWMKLAVASVGVALSVVAGNILARTPLAIGSALPALAFLFAGEMLAQVRVQSRWRQAFAGVILIALCLTPFIVGFLKPFDIKQGEWGTPGLSIVAAVGISWGMVLLARALPLPCSIGGWITTAALTGFTIVLVHPAILGLCRSVGALDTVAFVLGVVVPAAIGWIALRTTWSRWVTGLRELSFRDETKEASLGRDRSRRSEAPLERSFD